MERKIDFGYVMEVLNNNGIDQDYLNDNDNYIEAGTEEWMDVLGDIIGKNAYEVDEIEDEDHELVMEFIKVMEENGIELF
jgi:hypothetical protein